MLLFVSLLLAVTCIVPVAEAGAKGRKLPGANSFLRTGQTLPTGRQGAGMVLLSESKNVVVFGGVSGGGAYGSAKRRARRGRKRRCALSMPRALLSCASSRALRSAQRAEDAKDVCSCNAAARALVKCR
jgi:hypothetical protein